MTRKRRLLSILAISLAVLGFAAWTARARIGMALFDRVVAAKVGVDRSAALPDGLHVYVCGSGSPLADADRAGPCLAVLAGNDAFVFDSGSGSVRKLLRMGFPVEKLRAVFLTHLHSDHLDGLGELLLQAWVGGSRNTPLPVYGPAGVERVVAGFREAYALDSGYRVAHHGPKIVDPAGFGGAAQIIAVPTANPAKATVWEADGVRITVIKVAHPPIQPAYGYRIDYKGRSVAISGDTVYSPDFVASSRGVDVMFHEALNKPMLNAMSKALKQHGRANAAQIMIDIQDYHSSPQDAARAAQNAHAKALVLYHLVPSIPRGLMESAFVGDAARRFGGTLKVSRDGMLVSLPAGSKAIDFDQEL